MLHESVRGRATRPVRTEDLPVGWDAGLARVARAPPDYVRCARSIQLVLGMLTGQCCVLITLCLSVSSSITTCVHTLVMLV